MEASNLKRGYSPANPPPDLEIENWRIMCAEEVGWGISWWHGELDGKFISREERVPLGWEPGKPNQACPKCHRQMCSLIRGFAPYDEDKQPTIQCIPDYPICLNAMATAEATLTDYEHRVFTDELRHQVDLEVAENPDAPTKDRLYQSRSPLQRLRAFLVAKRRLPSQSNY